MVIDNDDMQIRMHLPGRFGYKKQFQKRQENTGYRDDGGNNLRMGQNQPGNHSHPARCKPAKKILRQAC